MTCSALWRRTFHDTISPSHPLARPRPSAIASDHPISKLPLGEAAIPASRAARDKLRRRTQPEFIWPVTDHSRYPCPDETTVQQSLYNVSLFEPCLERSVSLSPYLQQITSSRGSCDSADAASLFFDLDRGLTWAQLMPRSAFTALVL